MTINVRIFSSSIFLGIVTILSFAAEAGAEPNCDTALSRISKVAAQTAIQDHQENGPTQLYGALRSPI
jgi:hypothetical protein